MVQKISGGCACGAISYECNIDPVMMSGNWQRLRCDRGSTTNRGANSGRTTLLQDRWRRWQGS
jgi:hypothetical protein